MAVTRQQKEESLVELKEKFAKAKSVAFGQYAGISVEQISAMRKEMRAANVEFKVAKKTLMKIAAKENGVEVSDDLMPGTIAAIFSYGDQVSGPKIVTKFAKKIEVLKLVGGVMDGKTLSMKDVKALADLPSKEELLAKFMSMLVSPLRNFHGAISSPLASFARTTQAYADKQSRVA